VRICFFFLGVFLSRLCLEFAERVNLDPFARTIDLINLIINEKEKKEKMLKAIQKSVSRSRTLQVQGEIENLLYGVQSKSFNSQSQIP